MSLPWLVGGIIGSIGNQPALMALGFGLFAVFLLFKLAGVANKGIEVYQGPDEDNPTSEQLLSLRSFSMGDTT